MVQLLGMPTTLSARRRILYHLDLDLDFFVVLDGLHGMEVGHEELPQAGRSQHINR